MLSQKVLSFAKENITTTIKEELLLLSAIIKIGIFTSVESLYKEIYDTIIEIQVACSEIIKELEHNKRFEFLFDK